MDLKRWFKSKTDGSNFLTADTGSTICAYEFTHIPVSDEWVINHDNDSIILAVQVFINNELIEPDEITINNSNTFTINFSIPVSGVVNFLVLKVGTGVICNEITPTPTVTPTNTVTPTVTPTNTVTPTVTPTTTPDPTVTPTITVSITVSPTITVTPSITPTITVSPTVTPPPTQATGDGYAMGGGDSSSPSVNVIQRFPFSAPFTATTDIGNLSQTQDRGTGVGSSTDGYQLGGIRNEQVRIDRFPFSTPFTTATDVGNLSMIRVDQSGAQSSSDGYAVRQLDFITPGVDRLPFSTPFTTATDVGDLTTVLGSQAGAQDSTDGYVIGGDSGPTNTTNISRFPFSSPFTASNDIGDINNAVVGNTGGSSSIDGYSAAGSLGPSPTTISQVDKFPFSSPFTTASDVGDLDIILRVGAGSNSSLDGHVLGGLPTTGAAIRRYPFSSPFSTSTDIGDLQDLSFELSATEST